MNIEFVYIILTAINKFNEDENFLRSNTIGIYKNENQTVMTFKNLQVKENLDVLEGSIKCTEDTSPTLTPRDTTKNLSV
tara:strand:+ start:766 stop:1002 length:237 start_codon:yes stop_codon:yes gene_type:complete